MRSHHPHAIATAMLTLAVGLAHADSVGPGQRLELKFHLPAGQDPMLLLHPTDTVALGLPEDRPGGALRATADLFDGPVHLGRAISDGNQPFSFYWTDANSNFQFAAATLIQGDSLLDRSIDGRIQIQFDRVYHFDTVYLTVGSAIPRAVIGQPVTIDGITVAATVPEPGSTTLLLAGCMALSAFRLARRRGLGLPVPPA